MEYFEPKSISDALALLSKHGTEAKVIAGGTDVMVDIKFKEEPGCLVNIKKIPSLAGISESGGSAAHRRADDHPRDRNQRHCARQAAGALGSGAPVRLAAGAQHRHHRRQYLPRLTLRRNPDAAPGVGSQRDPRLFRRRAQRTVQVDFFRDRARARPASKAC